MSGYLHNPCPKGRRNEFGEGGIERKNGRVRKVTGSGDDGFRCMSCLHGATFGRGGVGE